MCFNIATALVRVFAIKCLNVAECAVRVSIPAWAGDLLFSQTVHTGSAAHPVSHSKSTGVSLRDKAPRA